VVLTHGAALRACGEIEPAEVLVFAGREAYVQVKSKGEAPPCGPSLRRVYPMGSMSMWHWIVVIGVVLLLFGRGKISELMGDVAQGIKAFKKGMTEDETAKVEPPKTEPVKTLDHQQPESAAASAAKSRAQV
jgi:sec-independent protein translocase protein TatA